MNRSTEYNRDMSRRKALRKRRIAKEIYQNDLNQPYYDNLHQYSKNKIHCSCPMCSRKTNNKSKRRKPSGNYSPSKNWGIKDQKRIEAMKEQNKEELE